MVRFRYLISLKRREKLPSCLKNVQIHETFGIGMINYDIQVTFRNLSYHVGAWQSSHFYVDILRTN